ncbi:NAD(P)/FAD-dependent oxidoreductase [Pseudomonas sp. Marseille-QA0892]
MSSSTVHTVDDSPDIAVVGAGVVGVCCALALARRGLRVSVLDPKEPGRGASYGNAGHLAAEQVFPIADLSILRQLPAMLSDPTGPLRLDWRYLPKALPWFMRLLWNLRDAPYRQSIGGIRALNEQSVGAWQRLLTSIGQPHLMKPDGSLLVYERPESSPALEALRVRMHEQQVAVERWDAPRIRAAAPALSERLQGGLFFPETAHFINPYRAVSALVASAKQLGVTFEQARVLGGTVGVNGVLLETDKGNRAARCVLIASGAHSAPVTAALTGKHVPLDTERGYHLMLPHEQDRLPFAVTSLERRFIMTPMADGLRLAGTVEFAGLERPLTPSRARQLERLSEGLFGQALDTSDATEWMGFRPSLPDSLPIIDKVRDGKVLLAFGHHHLGMTQAAVTAEMIAQMASPGAPGGAALPSAVRYRLDRF